MQAPRPGPRHSSETTGLLIPSPGRCHAGEANLPPRSLWACPPTCGAVGAVFVRPARLTGALLAVVVATALVKASLSAGAAVAQRAAAAADGGVATVEALGALEADAPDALRVQPAVAVLAAGQRPRSQQCGQQQLQE